jgi:hypothetical protein
VSALAHILESCGLATVALASVRPHVERIAPPRALFCDFPLGRPLGRPNDAAFQHRVLAAAFDMLSAPTGPVLRDFDEPISDDGVEVLACTLPPRFDVNELPAADEARALLAAYRRTVALNDGRTSVGRSIAPEQIGDALKAFQRIIEGIPWKQAEMPGGNPTEASLDIRVFYAEAALSLVDDAVGRKPGAWSTDSWFYERTEAGKLMLAAKAALKAADAPFGLWFYLTPMDR